MMTKEHLKEKMKCRPYFSLCKRKVTKCLLTLIHLNPVTFGGKMQRKAKEKWSSNRTSREWEIVQWSKNKKLTRNWKRLNDHLEGRTHRFCMGVIEVKWIMCYKKATYYVEFWMDGSTRGIIQIFLSYVFESFIKLCKLFHYFAKNTSRKYSFNYFNL